jgi:hypothetical protein
MKVVQQSFHLVAVVCFVVAVGAAGSAVADDVNWYGAGVTSEGTSHGDTSTQWNVAANWTPAGVPGPSDSAHLDFSALGSVYGETSTVGNVYFSSYLLGTFATFRILPGDVFTVNESLRAGESSVATLDQSGGSLSVGYFSLGDSGSYSLTQGSLHLTAGANLRGTVNMHGDSTAAIHADDFTIVDLSHMNFIDTSQGTYTAGANSLTIMSPVALMPFGYFHTDGQIYIRLGGSLPISPGQTLGGCGDLEDLVVAEGTLTARSWGFINLLGGVAMMPGGSVSLAGGTLRTDGVASTIDGGSLTSEYQIIGDAADGSLTQTGGQNVPQTRLVLGQNPGATGTYALQGGHLLAQGWDIVGYSGVGRFVQSGGTHTAAVGLDLGFAPGGVGSYEMTGGLLEVTENCFVGALGTGVFTQVGGVAQMGGLHLASVGGAAGTYNLQGGILTVAGNEDVGDFSGGLLLQSGGSHTVGGDLFVGALAETADGEFQLGAGQLRVAGNEWIGFSGNGRMIQTAGLHTVGNYLVLGASSVGTTAQSNTGALSLFGGSLTAPYVGVYGNSDLAVTGSGKLEIDGGLYLSKGGTGTRAFAGMAEVVLHDGSIAYLGQAAGTGQGAFQAGAETLTVLPPGADPNTFFGSFSSIGLVCNAGTIITIPPHVTVRGICELDDPLYCAGTMTARPGHFITPNAGVRVGPGGSLNLGGSDLIINDDWSGMEGGVLALGGSLVMGRGSARGAFDAAAGTVTIGGDIILATVPGSTGELRVGRNALVQAQDLTINYWPPPFTRPTKLTMELGLGSHGLISLTGVPRLGGELAVECASGYRPREGEAFTLITTSHLPPVISGDFIPITSNVTLGLQGLPAFAGGGHSVNYVVTFQGLTAGDANGDHSVDGGDLALLGGSWLMSGQTWATSDFTGDGLVDGGDIALLGGNWMWSLPAPAPSAGAPLPEPATLAMIALAGSALSLFRRRRL